MWWRRFSAAHWRSVSRATQATALTCSRARQHLCFNGAHRMCCAALMLVDDAGYADLCACAHCFAWHKNWPYLVPMGATCISWLDGVCVSSQRCDPCSRLRHAACSRWQGPGGRLQPHLICAMPEGTLGVQLQHCIPARPPNCKASGTATASEAHTPLTCCVVLASCACASNTTAASLLLAR